MNKLSFTLYSEERLSFLLKKWKMKDFRVSWESYLKATFNKMTKNSVIIKYPQWKIISPRSKIKTLLDMKPVNVTQAGLIESMEGKSILLKMAPVSI